jgi:hypothetical protein
MLVDVLLFAVVPATVDIVQQIYVQIMSASILNQLIVVIILQNVPVGSFVQIMFV